MCDWNTAWTLYFNPLETYEKNLTKNDLKVCAVKKSKINESI